MEKRVVKMGVDEAVMLQQVIQNTLNKEGVISPIEICAKVLKVFQLWNELEIQTYGQDHRPLECFAYVADRMMSGGLEVQITPEKSKSN